MALIIDEAQHLPLETLEQVWELAHPLAARALPLQIVLVGQPALQHHLQERHHHQVAQGLGLYATLEPFTAAESLAYIRQHVAKVALPGGPLFTPEALQALVRHAQGVARVLNRLCTDVLQAGCWAQQQPITAKLVRRVLAASTGGPPFPRRRRTLAVTAGVLLVASLLWVAPFHSRSLLDSRSATREEPAREAPPSPSGPPPPQAGPASSARGLPCRKAPAWRQTRALPASARTSVTPQPAEPFAPVIPSSPRRDHPVPQPTCQPAPGPSHLRPTAWSPPRRLSTRSPHRESTPPSPAPSSPPPSPQGYTLIRRIYCEDHTRGVLHGSTDLKALSPLSCEEAKHILLVWEQQKDHCQLLAPTTRESPGKTKEWIGTPSCPRP